MLKKNISMAYNRTVLPKKYMFLYLPGEFICQVASQVRFKNFIYHIKW